ncbi:hypothetical protein KEJ18_06440 [Candidatus Bathyarchaeota archaeon]|nr:hypothetical protein [Candidatus Bathyarchaeota archaeon]
MPLTPFHIGPGLFIPLLLFNIIDLPTFLIASVVLDIEPFIVLSLNLNYPIHGFFHTFLRGSIVALLLAFFMVKARKMFSPFMSIFKLYQKWLNKTIFSASFSGIYLHLFLDAQMHRDMQPFFPLATNQFLNESPLAGLMPEIFCVWCFIGAVLFYFIRLFVAVRKPKTP